MVLPLQAQTLRQLRLLLAEAVLHEPDRSANANVDVETNALEERKRFDQVEQAGKAEIPQIRRMS